MEGIGPEPKRQRIEYMPPQRLPPQPPYPPSSHGHPSTLPPPHSYPPPQQPPPPPSPYDVAPHDQRNLPDPTGPHAYVQEHSGHNTPIREPRFHHEPNYSRRSSTSAAQSPDGHHQYPPGRSMSVAGAAEGPHYPPPYGVDPNNPPAYTSHEPHSNGGVHHGLPTHPYDQPHAYASSHPVEYAHSPVNGGPSPYGPINPYAVQFGAQGSRPLKKGNRAQQACDVCRSRKAKCDEGRPECGYCVENGTKCNYQSVAPAKADRANQQIIDQQAAFKEDMKAFKDTWGGHIEEFKAFKDKWGGQNEKIENYEGRFDKIEQMLALVLSSDRLTRKQASDIKSMPLKSESPPERSARDVKPAPATAVSSRSLAKEQSTNNGSPNANESFSTVGADSTGSDPLTTQTNAIYIEHDTAAQKLFRWRSIKALLRQSKELRFSDRTEEYVMDYETNKGVLRIYGKGRQMREQSEGSQTSGSAASPANSSASGPSDEMSATSSPGASPDTLWGTGFIPMVSENRPVSDVGGLNSDNTLKLDPKTMARLLDSYLDNLHILHPFLEQRALTAMVERFKQRYNPQDPSHSKATYAVPVAIENLREHKIPKRKHSDSYYTSMSESALPPSPLSPKILLDRSPQTALILLVMALGKICECREDLPGPVPDGPNHASSFAANTYISEGRRTDSPPFSYPMRHSPSSSSHSTTNTSVPSPISLGRFGLSSPRSSVGDLPANVRNVDVIHGLAYYAQATDILGNLTGFHELVNAQCCLLAGLYAGQLANTLESLTWIQSASRICRLLVKKPSFKSMKEPKRDRIKLVFWTSLQLESDILAELDIPPSGIQEVQDVVPYPKLTTASDGITPAQGQQSEIMLYYSSQLYLRKLLNDIQKELYQENDPTFQRATRSTSLRNAFNEMVSTWRNNLPERLQWDDLGGIANTINDARLRGKYYAAQYIIHRPFLHAALDYDFEPPEILSPQAGNSGGLVPGPEMGPPKPTANYERRRAEIIELAVICIEAAVRSTLAFDGVLDHRRLVVTNIMGTAHAQFGNMLVLSAAFRSKTLGSYVDSNNLDWLFSRTIKLLKRLSSISQTLERDCFILQCLRKVVFEGGDSELTTSFSSEMS